jgi:molecular chaperone GrpE
MATVRVAREMLSVLDTFDRAFGAVKAETEEELAIEAEYKATYDQILGIFKELGVETVDTVGKEFDYAYHQAVMQKPSEFEEGIVCEEFAKGFVIGETLIRAAMVAVAA